MPPHFSPQEPGHYMLESIRPPRNPATARYNCTGMDVYEELLRLRKLGPEVRHRYHCSGARIHPQL